MQNSHFKIILSTIDSSMENSSTFNLQRDKKIERWHLCQHVSAKGILTRRAQGQMQHFYKNCIRSCSPSVGNSNDHGLIKGALRI